MSNIHKKRSYKKAIIDNKKPRQNLGEVFIYRSEKKDIIEINDKFIETAKPSCVQSLLTSVRDRVNKYENTFFQTCGATDTTDQVFLDQIESVDDLTYKCVNIARWRRGFGFVFLQLSLKDKGSARTTVFVTNTVHHSATSFGTTPGPGQAQQLLNEYLNDTDKVLSDICTLKEYHSTEKTASLLLEEMQK